MSPPAGTARRRRRLLEVTLGNALSDMGLSAELANALHAVSWWGHVAIILGFAVYIPMSKHIHLVGAPLSFVFRSLEAPGTLSTPLDLETAEVFGAANVRDFTQKAAPRRLRLRGLRTLHRGLSRQYQRQDALADAHRREPQGAPSRSRTRHLQREWGPDADSKPLIGPWIGQEALWDCLTCGACVQECPVGVEHIDLIVDMRRNLTMERAEIPETGMNALMSMEQRGHPWRGTTYTRTDWAEGLDVSTLGSRHPTADVLFWVGCTAALEKSAARASPAPWRPS